jgi:hypothetical protein
MLSSRAALGYACVCKSPVTLKMRPVTLKMRPATLKMRPVALKMRPANRCTPQVPSDSRELAEAALGFLGWRTVQGCRTGFDASVCDADLMPGPVGTGPLANKVPLMLVFCKDEYEVFAKFPGLKPRDIRSKQDAVERLARLLPVRGRCAYQKSSVKEPYGTQKETN